MTDSNNIELIFEKYSIDRTKLWTKTLPEGADQNQMFELNSDETKILLTINLIQKGFLELDAASGELLNSVGIDGIKPFASIYANDPDHIYYSGDLESDTNYSGLGKLNLKTGAVIWSKNVKIKAETFASGILLIKDGSLVVPFSHSGKTSLANFNSENGDDIWGYHFSHYSDFSRKLDIMYNPNLSLILLVATRPTL